MIQVHNLSYHIHQKQILQNLSFSIEEGGFYGLMGANGSGKTTLLKCLSNILETKKSVYLNSKDISLFKAKTLSKIISIVPQKQYIAFDFTAYQMVMMGRNPYQSHWQGDSAEDLSIVEQAMHETNTWHLKDQFMNHLSGGEYQRVIIARALAQQTPIIFLDEPLSNLDIAHQYEVLNLLRKQNKEKGKTILLVLHDLNMAWQYCNKILLLQDGKLAFNGNTQTHLTAENIEKIFSVKADFNSNALGEYIYLQSLQ